MIKYTHSRLFKFSFPPGTFFNDLLEDKSAGIAEVLQFRFLFSRRLCVARLFAVYSTLGTLVVNKLPFP